MTPSVDLEAEASEFARRLNQRVRAVLPGPQHPFGAVVLPGHTPRLLVGLADPADEDRVQQPLRLSIAGRTRNIDLHLRAEYYCCLDSQGRFLTIEESRFSVGLVNVTDPLLRYEFDRGRGARQRIPAAHLQVHAHRDEFTYLMAHADEGRPKERWRKQRMPRLAEFHFPMGGDRFRPCLEDVIWTLATEFGVQLKKTGWTILREGRAEWRRYQLASAVRDAPDTAADALRCLGWTVTATDNTIHDERCDRLTKP